MIAFLLLGQATAQKPGDLPADAPKPPPSVLTGQPNAEQPQPPGTPPAAARKPAVAPNEGSPPAPAGGGPIAKPLPQANRQSMPGPDIVLAMIRSTLLAFNDANITGNYDVLHALAAPTFQHDVTTETLGDSFKSFREQKIDLSPVGVLMPAFAKPPGIDQDGFLRVAGAFPSQPLQLRFSLAYQMIDGSWRYAGLAAEARPAQVGESTPPARAQSGAAVAENIVPAREPAPTRARKRERYFHVRSGLPPATKRW